MLLQLNRPADALAAFEATLKKEPNRFRAVYGAAQAAASGRQPRRRVGALRRTAAVASRADQGARTELAEARKATR